MQKLLRRRLTTQQLAKVEFIASTLREFDRMLGGQEEKVLRYYVQMAKACAEEIVAEGKAESLTPAELKTLSEKLTS